MRKIIVSNMVSLDGFFAGPNGELDWHLVGEEFNDIAIEQLNAMDAIMYGRITYEGMLSYWPTPDAIKNDPEVANKMNTLPKFVFSRTLDKVEWGEWNNATLLKGDLTEEITSLKQKSGRDIVIFGSGNLVAQMAQLSLIDEYRLFVVPTVLGKGIPLFNGVQKSINLKLVRTKTLKTGVVLLCYESQ